jgi:hypothetical protein
MKAPVALQSTFLVRTCWELNVALVNVLSREAPVTRFVYASQCLRLLFQMKIEAAATEAVEGQTVVMGEAVQVAIEVCWTMLFVGCTNRRENTLASYVQK